MLGDLTAAEVAECCVPASVMVLKGKPSPRPLPNAAAGFTIADVAGECPECTPNPPGLSWRLDLPLDRPWSLNDRSRMDRHRWSAIVRQLRADTAQLAAAAKKIPTLAALAVELHYVPARAGRRDPLNLVATTKIVEDGLVDANVVPDDAPRWVRSPMPTIHDPTRFIGDCGSRVYVIVRELPAGGG